MKTAFASSLLLAAALLAGCGGIDNSVVPTIVSQPIPVTAIEGTPFALSVSATGSDLTYQWYQNGTAISGATSASYTVTTAAMSSAGSYTVTITNSYGTVTSNAATVTVTAATTG